MQDGVDAPTASVRAVTVSRAGIPVPDLSGPLALNAMQIAAQIDPIKYVPAECREGRGDGGLRVPRTPRERIPPEWCSHTVKMSQATKKGGITLNMLKGQVPSTSELAAFFLKKNLLKGDLTPLQKCNCTSFLTKKMASEKEY